MAVNVRAALDAADQAVAHHHLPFVPHLCHFWHVMSPKPYPFWMEYDSLWMFQCDVVWRLPGYSPGADQEVQAAQLADMPVVYSIEELDQLRDRKVEKQVDDLRKVQDEYREKVRAKDPETLEKRRLALRDGLGG